MTSRRPEEDLQRAIVDMLHACVPAGSCMWFHVPNGGGRSKAEAGILKALGVKAGVPDLIFLRRDAPPLFIELKSAKGVLSQPQKDFRDACRSLGCAWELARSCADVQTALMAHGVLFRGRLT